MNWSKRLALLGLCLWLISLSQAAWAFSFVVFGDNRGGDKIFQALIKKINIEDNVFAVSLGDTVMYPREKDYLHYLGMVKDLKCKLYQVPGNHDLYSGGEKWFKKYFGALYYSFDYDNSHFIVLNNAYKEYFDAQQFNWLKDDLAACHKENIFVFMHKPTFDPSEIYADHIMSGRKTIEELMALFSRYKVKYVFAGHIHGYARAERNGVTYIVTAGAGSPLYLPREYGGFYNYVRMTVDGDKIRDEVKMIYE